MEKMIQAIILCKERRELKFADFEILLLTMELVKIYL